jgi:hypothetical protein
MEFHEIALIKTGQASRQMSLECAASKESDVPTAPLTDWPFLRDSLESAHRCLRPARFFRIPLPSPII